MIEAFQGLRELHRVFEATQATLEKQIGKSICVSNCGLCCQHNTPVWRTIEAILAVSVMTGIGGLAEATSISEGWLLEHHDFAKTYEGMPQGLASPRLRDEWVGTFFPSVRS